MAREIKIKGRKAEDIKGLNTEDFHKIIGSRERRTLKRGMTPRQKKLLEQIKKSPPDKFHKTHERDMVIMPEMIGHRLGEFSLTRRRVKHSDPGAGATRGSKHVPLK